MIPGNDDNLVTIAFRGWRIRPDGFCRDMDAPPQKRAEASRVAEQMPHKLRTAEGRAVYKLRKAVVEPVLGHIKEAPAPQATVSHRGEAISGFHFPERS